MVEEIRVFNVGDKVKWRENHKSYPKLHAKGGSWKDTSEDVMIVKKLNKGNPMYGKMLELETLCGAPAPAALAYRFDLVEAFVEPKPKKEKKVKNVKMANANKVYAVVLEDTGYVLGLRADRDSARELKVMHGGAKSGVVIQQYAPSKVIR